MRRYIYNHITRDTVLRLGILKMPKNMQELR